MNIPLNWIVLMVGFLGVGFGCLLQMCYEYMRKKFKKDKEKST